MQWSSLIELWTQEKRKGRRKHRLEIYAVACVVEVEMVERVQKKKVAETKKKKVVR